MVAPLRVALVGAGRLGRRYARVLREATDAELVAVVNRTPSRAEALAERDARAFASLGAALDAVEADAVVVATADHVHRAPVLEALGRGLDVMVEKPLATTSGAAREMAAAAAGQGRIVKVNHSQRWVEDYRWIRARIEAGAIGRPRLAQHVRHDRIDVPTEMIPGWVEHTSPLFFMSSHDLDLVAWFLDARPARVAGQEHVGVLLGRGFHVHDAVDAHVTYESGATATFHTSWIHPRSHPVIATDRFMIVGDDGSIAYDGRTRRAELHGAGGEEIVEFTGPHTADEVDGRLKGAFAASVGDFVRCVRERAEPATSAARMLPLTDTQTGLLAAIEAGRTIALDPRDWPGG
ncbi:MAG: Gfo/Idh/MocA family oxidoreductase [Gemmatimonadetes bacterium]|nr:Gfo/Idh/MocA family oxidoreductase [Gemmatimonadota bacterium]NIQ58100.1 Gfo/Idh/MocA family oxidoreductase [Gemmatimonadota bacterium]NIU78302.1 Gfo/Idh/MocA family oxidoreductase [Gammaproteobacteria bacterium]NIX47256.1 Gfo/Idh/MocA family oxidoreductase [Gemmatimonadota bacterium]NIY11633.1 Gfo/Idh/MocA family oxidoreductase [Gemmatimonadota bacterium]